VQTHKDAGITPIIAGGQNKWPLYFYWSYPALRHGGPNVVTDAMAGENGGFTTEPFVAAEREFQRLTELEPFQSGYISNSYESASGMFADGASAFHLMGD
jgi:raffinose/stachyose/melibiose transport system substrate-binding protein